jgi:hypothetical protein
MHELTSRLHELEGNEDKMKLANQKMSVFESMLGESNEEVKMIFV